MNENYLIIYYIIDENGHRKQCHFEIYNDKSKEGMIKETLKTLKCDGYYVVPLAVAQEFI